MGANYARLLLSVILGLVTVRLILAAAGDRGWGLVALLGSSIGFGSMFLEITRRCMVREIGTAYHSGDDDEFRRAYNSALPIGVGAMLIGAAIFTALWLLVPVLDVSPLEDAARSFIVAVGLSVCVQLLLTPSINMLLISESMTLFNFWLLMVQRGGQFLGALAVVWFFKIDDAGRVVVIFGWISAGIAIASTLLAAAASIITDRRRVPALRFVSLRTTLDIIRMSGWNAGAVTAMSLHIRVDQIIMNLVFGLSGNVIFGIGVLLTSYARRVTQGVTDGLDAVAARFEAQKGEEGAKRLMRQATRLQGMIVFPAGLLVVVLVEPLILFWVGDRLETPDQTIPPAILIVQVLMLGIMARAISDAWGRILYGAGHVHRYAWLVLLGGLANPPLALLLIWLFPAGHWELAGPALSHTIIMVVVHGVLLAVIAARVTGQRTLGVFAPLLRPLIASLLPLPAVLVGMRLFDEWTIGWLIGLAALYSFLYVVVTLFLTMDDDDRRILKRILRRGRSAKMEIET